MRRLTAVVFLALVLSGCTPGWVAQHAAECAKPNPYGGGNGAQACRHLR